MLIQILLKKIEISKKKLEFNENFEIHKVMDIIFVMGYINLNPTIYKFINIGLKYVPSFNRINISDGKSRASSAEPN